MFSWLAEHFIRHFIPQEGNDHRPHILRNYSAYNIVAILIFLEIFTFLVPTFTHINTTDNMAAVLPAVLASLTNEERQAQNLQPLTVNPILNKAAQMKATDMAMNGYFAHTSPDGKTPWYWLAQAGYQYQYAGENLAVNFSDSKDVTNAWMASPTHKANIVKGNYTEVGTGVANGVYEGQEAIFVAQVYANPLPEVLKQIQPVKTGVKTTSASVAGGKKVPAIATLKESPNVLGAEVTAPNLQAEIKPAFWQQLLASPRNTTNIILYIVFGIIFIALLLYIFIKIKNYHKNLIINGLFIIAVIVAIFLTNFYLSHKDVIISQSFDYSYTIK